MTAGRPAAQRVRLVVLNHDNGEDLPACLDALAALRWPGPAPEVVVVDNASTDGSVPMVRERYPWVRLVLNGENTGFPANNLGLTGLDGFDLVGLVNPDTEVDPDWLVESATVLESDEAIGAVSPTLVFPWPFVEIDVRIDPPGTSVRLDAVSGITRPDLVHRVGSGGGPSMGLPLALDHSGVLRLPLDPARYTGDGSGGGPGDHDGSPPITLPLTPPLTLRVTSGGAERTTVRAGDSTTIVSPRSSVDIVLTPPQDRVTVVQNRGIEADPTGNGLNVGFLERLDDSPAVPHDVFGWCGAAMLARPQYFADVGLFEERLFLYYEDLDLSWRARTRGWRHVHAPAAVVRHHHGASRNPDVAERYGARNRVLVSTRNASALGAGRAWVTAIGGCVRLAAGGVRSPTARHLAGVRARGLVEAATMLPWALRSRRRLRTGTPPGAPE